ncbi:MAG: hypothetical protein IPK77_09460 [Cellvibrio sp.]|nr:hypothetical protein [Cellvibrio sp.]
MRADNEVFIARELLSREQLIEKIKRGDYLMIAADETMLKDLPAGNWIAGTIPYFMTPDGGVSDKNKIFVHTVEGISPSKAPRISIYDVNSISRIAQETPEHGFTLVILPALSEIHLSYAKNAPDYPNMYFSPIIGWIAGIHLSDMGNLSPKVGFGPANGMLADNQVVAMHIPLPEQQLANINTVNLFVQGDGPSFTFPQTGFHVDACNIDGKSGNLADFIKTNNIDTRWPLVANYCGVMINVSIQQVNDNSVNLYAPVFADITYRFAKPVDNYIESFNQNLPKSDVDKIAFSCNCILNYLYAELEGKKTGSITGPMTFGEVAYQLMNQTLVYLTLSSSR